MNKFAAAALLWAALTSVATAGDACVAADQDSDAAGILASESGANILTVGSPICLQGTEPDDNVAPTSRVHVFPGTEPVQGAMAGLIGKAISVKGKLYGSRSNKFNAPILMEALEVAAK